MHSSSFLAGGGESAELSVLHLGRGNPVDTGVTADSLVGWVNHDDFVELEGSVLTNPVRVENTHVGALATNTLFSEVLEGTAGLDLLDATGALGLTADHTLGGRSFTSTSADADAVDNVTLLGLVAELSCLIGARRSAGSVNVRELTVLPGSDSEDESADI